MLLKVLVELLALRLAAGCYYRGPWNVGRYVGQWIQRCFVPVPDYIDFGSVPAHTVAQVSQIDRASAGSS